MYLVAFVVGLTVAAIMVLSLIAGTMIMDRIARTHPPDH